MNRTPPPSSLGSRGKIPEKGFCEACLLVSDQWVQSLFFFFFDCLFRSREAIFGLLSMGTLYLNSITSRLYTPNRKYCIKTLKFLVWEALIRATGGKRVSAPMVSSVCTPANLTQWIDKVDTYTSFYGDRNTTANVANEKKTVSKPARGLTRCPCISLDIAAKTNWTRK